MPSSLTLFGYLSVALAAVAPVLGASPTITARDSVSINPQGITLHPVDDPVIQRRAPLPVPQTNAERMKRGLNPMKPKRFAHEGRSLQARHSPAPCTPYNGRIKAIYTNPDVVRDLGLPSTDKYISKQPNSYGEYTVTDNVDNALHVTFCASPETPFEIHTTNGIQSFTLLGLIKGWANTGSQIGSELYNYLYFGGVSHTEAYDAPTDVDNSFHKTTDIDEAAESTIWYYDQGSRALTVEWINPGGNTPTAFPLYAPNDDALVVTGDAPAFQSHFYNSPSVTFTFEPTP